MKNWLQRTNYLLKKKKKTDLYLPPLIYGIGLKFFWKNALSEFESESHSIVSDSLQPHGLYAPRNSPGQNTGWVFPTQESNLGLLHCRWILYSWAIRKAHKVFNWLCHSHRIWICLSPPLCISISIFQQLLVKNAWTPQWVSSTDLLLQILDINILQRSHYSDNTQNVC